MAEVMEGAKMAPHMHSNEHGKINAALTTGIIGTSLSGLMALGALGKGVLGNGLFGTSPSQTCSSSCCNTPSTCGTLTWGSGWGVPFGTPFYGAGYGSNWSNGFFGYPGAGWNMPIGDLYNERKECEDYINLTKQYYEGQIATDKEINQNFFDLYKMGTDNAFSLYKSQVAGDAALSQRLDSTAFSLYKNHVDDSFALYKGQRDNKDELEKKINSLERQIDVMSAIRPYQDALINAKIDNVALVGDFNLARRTCRMIQGELVLPSTPTVTGYPSYCCCSSNTTQAAAAQA